MTCANTSAFLRAAIRPALLVAAWLASASGANAGLIGNQVRWSFGAGTVDTIAFDRGTRVASAAAQEFQPQALNDFAVDLGGSVIRMDYIGVFAPTQFLGGDFQGFGFTDTNGTIPDISGVQLSASTNVAGLDATRVTFDANGIYINLDGLTVNFTNVIEVEVQFAGADPDAFLGQEVRWTYDVGTPGTVAIDRGTRVASTVPQEFRPQPLNDFVVDLADDFIRIDYFGVFAPTQFLGGGFQGFVFSDANGTVPALIGASLDPLTNVAGLDAGRLGFDANHVYLNLDGLTWNFRDLARVDLQFAAQVPDASPLALAAIGYGVVGLARLRARRR